MNRPDKLQSLDETFLEEYTSHKAILKYTRATAGFGVSYLLDHDYKAVYFMALAQLPPEVKKRGIRLLEFGCGGGMNIIYLTSILKEKGVKVERAIGTDFSPALIDAAKRELDAYLQEHDGHKVEFCIARNESLVQDLATAIGKERKELPTSFDFVLGVNTIRYCHRGQREIDCARDIMELLVPGGICVVIDMNDRFPVFRSTLRNYFREIAEEESYIPSLEEYAAPFEQVGFEVLRKEHFCWIPHSGGRVACSLLRGISPLLSAVAPTRAMRSLVVVRKPMTAAVAK